MKLLLCKIIGCCKGDVPLNNSLRNVVWKEHPANTKLDYCTTQVRRHCHYAITRYMTDQIPASFQEWPFCQYTMSAHDDQLPKLDIRLTPSRDKC
jgi:hypothetical protein